MPKVTPTLWFNYNAEEAVGFWTSLLPDSRIDDIIRAPSDNPSMEKGAVLAITFTIAGQKYNGINGGPQFPFSEVLSFAIACDDQAEVDRYWDALLAGGGQPSQCGWLKDRFGFSLQVVPRRLYDLMRDPDPARAERASLAMLKMVKLDIAALEAAADAA